MVTPQKMKKCLRADIQGSSWWFDIIKSDYIQLTYTIAVFVEKELQCRYMYLQYVHYDPKRP